MFTVHQSASFAAWLESLDPVARGRIVARVRRVELGDFGDCKPLAGGISELRIDAGPGYRIYCMRTGKAMLVLLAGGDKSSQAADIKRARQIAEDWEG